MRHEFPVAVKRAALARSKGRCEAVGVRYGHKPGERCRRRVSDRRVNYEHYPRGAHDPHPDTRSLGNCWAICPECNQYAANHTDKQVEQKIKNVSYDEALHRARMERKAGLDTPDPPKPRGRQGKSRPITGRREIPSRPFPKRRNSGSPSP